MGKVGEGESIIMKIAIYHRKSSTESDEEFSIKLANINDWLVAKQLIEEGELVPTYIDTADRLEQQANLSLLLADSKQGLFNLVVCFSPITLSNCAWPNFLNILTTLSTSCGVKFVSWLGVEINCVVEMLGEWENQKASQRQLVIAGRDSPPGRPKKLFDVEEAIRLRTEEQLTFKEIGDRLKVSTALVYKNLPKHVKGWLGNEMRRRVRKK